MVVASQEAEPEDSEVHGQPRQGSDTCLIHEIWAALIKITLLFKRREEGEGKGGGGNRDGEWRKGNEGNVMKLGRRHVGQDEGKTKK